MNWEIQLTRPVRMRHCGSPEMLCTLGEAVDMIDEQLPETVRTRADWQQVKNRLVTAAETKQVLDIEAATALLELTLEQEGWLC